MYEVMSKRHRPGNTPHIADYDVLWGLLLGSVCGLVATILPNRISLLGLILVLMAILALKLPEFGLALVIFAGRFRNLPVVQDMLPFVNVCLLVLPFVALAARMKYRRRISSFGACSNAALQVSYAALGVWLVFGLIYTGAPRYGGQKALEFWLYTLPESMLIMHICSMGVQHVETMTRSIHFISYGAGLVGLIAGIRSGSAGRLSLPSGGANVFGRITAIGVLTGLGLCILSYQRDRSTPRRTASLVGTLGLLIISFLSGSRGAVISLTIAVSVMIFSEILFGRTSKGYALKLGIIGLVGLSSAYVVASLLNPSIRYRFQLMLAADKGGSITVREYWFRESFALWTSRPILGHGTGAFASLFGYGDVIAYPHNIIAEICLENGIIGLVLLVITMCNILLGYLNLVNDKDTTEDEVTMGSMSLGLVTFAFVGALVTGDLYDNRLIWVFGAMLTGIWNSVRFSRHTV